MGLPPCWCAPAHPFFGDRRAREAAGTSGGVPVLEAPPGGDRIGGRAANPATGVAPAACRALEPAVGRDVPRRRPLLGGRRDLRTAVGRRFLGRPSDGPIANQAEAGDQRQAAHERDPARPAALLGHALPPLPDHGSGLADGATLRVARRRPQPCRHRCRGLEPRSPADLTARLRTALVGGEGPTTGRLRSRKTTP
jgi:hypothetical protein